MGIKFANSAFATLAAGINSSVTSITLTTGQGARFPSLAGGDYFFATLIDTSNNLEIVKCTARATDVLTVVRGQESTTARAFATGDRIELRVTAQGLVDAGAASLDGDRGDITVSSLGTVWTIDSLVVTDAKINSMAATKLTGTIDSARMFSGAVLNATGYDFTTRVSLSHSSYTDYFTGSYTKQRSSSNLIAIVQASGRSDGNGAASSRFVLGTSTVYGASKYTTSVHTDIVTQVFYISGNTQTGSLSWAYAQTHHTFSVLNPNSGDDARISNCTSRVVILEVAA